MTLGTVIMVIGIYFFKYTNNFSTGGVSGMSVILAHYIPQMTPGIIGLIINGILLVVGYLTLGRDFGYKTAYVSLLQSILLRLLEIDVVFARCIGREAVVVRVGQLPDDALEPVKDGRV